jgi:hypothetical protein
VYATHDTYVVVTVNRGIRDSNASGETGRNLQEALRQHG